MGIPPGNSINESPGYLITDIRESVLIYAKALSMKIYSNFLMLAASSRKQEDERELCESWRA
jgi:hypothetical protein